MKNFRNIGIIGLIVFALLVGGYFAFPASECDNSENPISCKFIKEIDEQDNRKVSINDLGKSFDELNPVHNEVKGVGGVFPDVQKFLNFFRRTNS